AWSEDVNRARNQVDSRVAFELRDCHLMKPRIETIAGVDAHNIRRVSSAHSSIADRPRPRGGGVSDHETSPGREFTKPIRGGDRRRRVRHENDVSRASDLALYARDGRIYVPQQIGAAHDR